MAPLICAALALLAPLQYRRPAANSIRAPPILLRPAIDGPTGQLDEADSLRAEIQNDLGHRRLREAALGLTRLARLTNSLPEPQLYDAALAAFTAAPSQHRLVMRLAALLDSYPSSETPPSSEASEAFVVSAADQKLWSASLGWWEQLGADAIAASIPAREAAVHSMARVGRYAQAEALLKQVEPTARGLRLVLSACAAQQERVGAATRSKAAGGLTAAALARRSFTLATDAEVADASMLRDCLSTCADAGEHADGLALLSSAPLNLHADAAVETLAGILHGGRGDAAASIAALHRARRASATAPAVAESLPPPLVPSRHLETLFLACARAGCWRDARWLRRASAGEEMRSHPPRPPPPSPPALRARMDLSPLCATNGDWPCLPLQRIVWRSRRKLLVWTWANCAARRAQRRGRPLCCGVGFTGCSLRVRTARARRRRWMRSRF